MLKLEVVSTNKGISAPDSKYFITISDNNIHVIHRKGPMLPIPVILYSILSIQEGAIEFRKAIRYKRSNPYRVIRRSGMSGSEDITLEIAEPVGTSSLFQKKEVAKLHVSMYAKDSRKELEAGIFIPDLLEIMNCYILDYEKKENMENSINILICQDIEDVLRGAKERLEVLMPSETIVCRISNFGISEDDLIDIGFKMP